MRLLPPHLLIAVRSSCILSSSQMSSVGAATLLLTLGAFAFAAPEETCPVDLAKIFERQNSVSLPWDRDTLGRVWAQRPKYYLIVGVTKIAGAENADDDFAKVDIAAVESRLCQLGYAPVPNAPHGGVLGGIDATQDNLFSSLESTADISSENPLLIFYFSGHGIPGQNGDDLYLPLFNSKALTIIQSQSLKTILAKLRSTYQGDLIVVLDACFSGTATVGRLLTTVDDFRRTAILTSSSYDEYSYPITVNAKQQTVRFPTTLSMLS